LPALSREPRRDDREPAVGFGLVFRDGVALLLGFATAALAVIFNVAVVVVVWQFIL
jgi:hypothetical protein